MLDPKYVYDNLFAVSMNLAKRGYEFPYYEFESSFRHHKYYTTKLQDLQRERNQNRDRTRGQELKLEIQEIQVKVTQYKEALMEVMMNMPNTCHKSVPGEAPTWLIFANLVRMNEGGTKAWKEICVLMDEEFAVLDAHNKAITEELKLIGVMV